MTNAEAIETLRANYPDACYEQLREAVDVAIEALNAQGAAGDTISRQAAIDAVRHSPIIEVQPAYMLIDKADVLKNIVMLPSAQRTGRKKGKWKIKTINTFEMAYGSTGYEPVYECSVCGRVEESYLRFDEPIMPEDADFPNFCPNCGAEMEVEE